MSLERESCRNTFDKIVGITEKSKGEQGHFCTRVNIGRGTEYVDRTQFGCFYARSHCEKEVRKEPVSVKS